MNLGLGASLESELASLDDAIPDAVQAFEQSLEERRASLVEALQNGGWDKVPETASSPRSKLRHLAARLLWQARELGHAAHGGHREALQIECAELSARSDLATSKAAVCDLLVNLKRHQTLDQCRKELKQGQSRTSQGAWRAPL